MEKTMTAEELSRNIARIWNKSRQDDGYTSDIAEKDAISLINQFKKECEENVRDEHKPIYELIDWLNDECPHATMTYDLSHDFAELLRNRLDKILNLKI